MEKERRQRRDRCRLVSASATETNNSAAALTTSTGDGRRALLPETVHPASPLLKMTSVEASFEVPSAMLRIVWHK